MLGRLCRPCYFEILPSDALGLTRLSLPFVEAERLETALTISLRPSSHQCPTDLAQPVSLTHNIWGQLMLSDEWQFGTQTLSGTTYLSGKQSSVFSGRETIQEEVQVA